MSRTLQVTGVLALFLWTVGGLVAWSLVQGRVEVVVHNATASSDWSASKVAVLQEDLIQLRKDLEALTAATQAGFKAVDTADANRTSTATNQAPTAKNKAPTAAKNQAPTATLAAKPARKRGFLAFKLPDSGFRFDKLQRFEIIPSLSRVGFDGKSTLHAFSGISTSVRGRVTACLANPDVDCNAWGEIEASSLRTGHDGRDQAMFETLSTTKHRKITFRIQNFTPTKVDKEALVVEGTATGRMTIRGVTHSHNMTVKLSFDSSRRLLIEGEGKINLKDYKVPVPTALGFIKMHEEVKIWIAVQARCLGRVTKTAAKEAMNEVARENRKEIQHDAR